MLNFVVCDDNVALLNRLVKMLESIFTKNNFEASIGLQTENIDTVLNYIDSHTVDVLILDINLKSNKNGLDVAERLRKTNKNSYLIFTTGHLEYAMIAYKYKTFDFLAKPITLERLEDTIIRLFEDMNGQPRKYIRIDGRNTIVDEAEIQYIKRDGMKLVFHTSSRDYDTYSSFNKFQDKLPENYVRCHKSFIANLEQIRNIEPVTNTITFKNGDTCELGPKYKLDFLEVFKNYGNFE